MLFVRKSLQKIRVVSQNLVTKIIFLLCSIGRTNCGCQFSTRVCMYACIYLLGPLIFQTPTYRVAVISILNSLAAAWPSLSQLYSPTVRDFMLFGNADSWILRLWGCKAFGRVCLGRTTWVVDRDRSKIDLRPKNEKSKTKKEKMKKKKCIIPQISCSVSQDIQTLRMKRRSTY